MVDAGDPHDPGEGPGRPDQLEPAPRSLGAGSDPDQGAEAARITERTPVEVRADRPVMAVQDIADVPDYPVDRGQIQVAAHGDHSAAVREDLTAQLDRDVIAARIEGRRPPRPLIVAMRLAVAARHDPSPFPPRSPPPAVPRPRRMLHPDPSRHPA